MSKYRSPDLLCYFVDSFSAIPVWQLWLPEHLELHPGLLPFKLKGGIDGHTSSYRQTLNHIVCPSSKSWLNRLRPDINVFSQSNLWQRHRVIFNVWILMKTIFVFACNVIGFTCFKIIQITHNLTDALLL